MFSNLWYNQIAPALSLAKQNGVAPPLPSINCIFPPQGLSIVPNEAEHAYNHRNPARSLEMDPSGKYDEAPPAYSPSPIFVDPFASLEGRVGSLSLNTNRNHASSNAASTISVQYTNTDGENGSMAGGSSRTSNSSPTFWISRDVWPSKHASARADEENGIVPSRPLPPRDNEESIFPTGEVCPLDKDRSKSPTDCGSQRSFDPDLTPRASSVGSQDRNTSLDGGVELCKSHGARLCKCSLQSTLPNWDIDWNT